MVIPVIFLWVTSPKSFLMDHQAHCYGSESASWEKGWRCKPYLEFMKGREEEKERDRDRETERDGDRDTERETVTFCLAFIYIFF